MTSCDLCRDDRGIYDSGRDCCLARFILHVPTKLLRIEYLNWFMQKYGAERTEKVKEVVANAWAERNV